MGAPLIKKDYRHAVARVRRFNSMSRHGDASVTVAVGMDDKVIGYFFDHEAAARWCQRTGIQFKELKSEQVRA